MGLSPLDPKLPSRLFLTETPRRPSTVKLPTHSRSTPKQTQNVVPAAPMAPKPACEPSVDDNNDNDDEDDAYSTIAGLAKDASKKQKALRESLRAANGTVLRLKTELSELRVAFDNARSKLASTEQESRLKDDRLATIALNAKEKQEAVSQLEQELEKEKQARLDAEAALEQVVRLAGRKLDTQCETAPQKTGTESTANVRRTPASPIGTARDTGCHFHPDCPITCAGRGYGHEPKRSSVNNTERPDELKRQKTQTG